VLRIATSGRPLSGGRCAIAAVLRWQDTGEAKTVLRRLRRGAASSAPYRAMLLGLSEARRMGARAVRLGTTDADAAAALSGGLDPPPEALGLYLQARALLNGFRSADVRVIDPSADADAAAAAVAAETAGTAAPAVYADLPLWAAS
jgi:ribonuclease HI